MSHIAMSHVPHRKGWGPTYQSSLSHIPIHHVIHTNESCLTYHSVMFHTPKSQVSYSNQSCLTHMSQILMSPVTHIGMSHVTTIDDWYMRPDFLVSCLTHQSVISRIAMRHASPTKQSDGTYPVIPHRAQHVIAHVVWHNMSQHTKHNNTSNAA